MNIKEHYSLMARLYFHQSVLFAVVFIVVILPNIQKSNFFLANMAGLAVFLCLVYFILRFIYFSYKSSVASMLLSNGANGNGMETFLLVTPHHNDSLMEAYSSDGIRRLSLLTVKGKERQERFTYYRLPNRGRLYKINEHGLGTTAYMHIDQRSIHFITGDKVVPVVLSRAKRAVHLTVGADRFEIKSPYSDRLILKNGQMVLSVKKGRMPIKWQQSFSPNTPLLRIDNSLSKETRSLCLFLFILF
ncbi:hypothetical protein ACFSCZ_07830 [Siminovitchia sediminis]|uniref:Uncharacterized protein n=1 Tax=Siminovitchia sediminis TaxID=1274353 RepID=A0ABW4KEM1_9BACI